jgi:hypothetical protein
MRWLPTLLLALVACRAAGPPPNAPLDVKVDLVVGKSIEHDPQARACTAYLKADRISKSMSTCVLDEQVSREIGTLTYPCEGDGTAEAVFGEHKYVGRIEGNKLTLSFETELDWSDGCRWATHHAIRGTISRSGEDGSLSWRYSDNPIHRAEEECSGSCTANTRLAMSSTRPAEDRIDDDPDELEADP